VKGKKVARSVKLYKRAQKCQYLSQKLASFLYGRWQEPHCQLLTKTTTSQNQIFYLSVLQMKSSSTYLITASICEGSFFYFYVESPPSNFMHRLREHSCNSEYNVHCPKVIIDWFIILVSLILKLFVSSRPLKLEGVICIYVLLFHEGQAENHLLCFPYDLNTRLTFIVSLFMMFRLCSSSCYNMVAKFLIVKIISFMPMF
jgi:hypothetical protein